MVISCLEGTEGRRFLQVQYCASNGKSALYGYACVSVTVNVRYDSQRSSEDFLLLATET